MKKDLEDLLDEIKERMDYMKIQVIMLDMK